MSDKGLVFNVPTIIRNIDYDDDRVMDVVKLPTPTDDKKQVVGNPPNDSPTQLWIIEPAHDKLGPAGSTTTQTSGSDSTSIVYIQNLGESVKNYLNTIQGVPIVPGTDVIISDPHIWMLVPVPNGKNTVHIPAYYIIHLESGYAATLTSGAPGAPVVLEKKGSHKGQWWFFEEQKGRLLYNIPSTIRNVKYTPNVMDVVKALAPTDDKQVVGNPPNNSPTQLWSIEPAPKPEPIGVVTKPTPAPDSAVNLVYIRNLGEPVKNYLNTIKEDPIVPGTDVIISDPHIWILIPVAEEDTRELPEKDKPSASPYYIIHFESGYAATLTSGAANAPVVLKEKARRPDQWWYIEKQKPKAQVLFNVPSTIHNLRYVPNVMDVVKEDTPTDPKKLVVGNPPNNTPTQLWRIEPTPESELVGVIVKPPGTDSTEFIPVYIQNLGESVQNYLNNVPGNPIAPGTRVIISDPRIWILVPVTKKDYEEIAWEDKPSVTAYYIIHPESRYAATLTSGAPNAPVVLKERVRSPEQWWHFVKEGASVPDVSVS